jgi:hypothetical protein
MSKQANKNIHIYIHTHKTKTTKHTHANQTKPKQATNIARIFPGKPDEVGRMTHASALEQAASSITGCPLYA